MHINNNMEGSAGANSLADDSGCASDDGAASAVHTNPEQSLFLVMQELRKSRSEVERLSKSEHWYKHELKSQKLNRLETLERLYEQERKYMQENQRLQQECMRLYAKCAALERQIQTEAGEKSQQTGNNRHIQQHISDDSLIDTTTQQEPQEPSWLDQSQLIEVLRKQKKLLLADIQRLSLEYDDKLSHLQSTLAGIALENKHMTGKCKQLMDEKAALEHSLDVRNGMLRTVTSEREHLRQVIGDLNETLLSQEQLLAIKEQEFLDLKKYYNDKLSRESSMDAVHSYSMAFHAEISAKTAEIATLKNSLHELQNELLQMSELEAQNESQQRQLEHLNFEIQQQSVELENLKTREAFKSNQLDEAIVDRSLLQAQLIELHKQYSEICAKCENLKFELDLEQREHQKLQFVSHEKEEEILQLRANLTAHERKCELLSIAMIAAESNLDSMHRDPLKTDVETQTDTNSSTDVDDELPLLKQRIQILEEQLQNVESQKDKTVSLLQQLLKQQDDKIKSTTEAEADWRQLLEALKATQQIDEELRMQLKLKSDELEHLNALFESQNEQLQQLSKAQEKQQYVEVEEMKQSFQETLTMQVTQTGQIKELHKQLKMLLAEKEQSPKNKATEPLRVLIHILELETGRKHHHHIKSWQHFAKQLRKELRTAKMTSRKPEEFTTLRNQLANISEQHEQAQSRIKQLEETLTTERKRFAASELTSEPTHEVANLIDDYKKLIQQSAKETRRPRTSHILDLIERSNQCNNSLSLCQLSENVSACRLDMNQLNDLLIELEHCSQTGRERLPSLMEELLAVSETSTI